MYMYTPSIYQTIQKFQNKEKESFHFCKPVMFQHQLQLLSWTLQKIDDQLEKFFILFYNLSSLCLSVQTKRNCIQTAILFEILSLLTQEIIDGLKLSCMMYLKSHNIIMKEKPYNNSNLP